MGKALAASRKGTNFTTYTHRTKNRAKKNTNTYLIKPVKVAKRKTSLSQIIHTSKIITSNFRGPSLIIPCA